MPAQQAADVRRPVAAPSGVARGDRLQVAMCGELVEGELSEGLQESEPPAKGAGFDIDDGALYEDAE